MLRTVNGYHYKRIQVLYKISAREKNLLQVSMQFLHDMLQLKNTRTHLLCDHIEQENKLYYSLASSQS
jgi:hypothetical protein